MPSNVAAWQMAEKARPLEVKPAPYTSPGEKEIVIKNGAVAINPVDWTLQDLGSDLFKWVKYPYIFGLDVAGEVVEVGSEVSQFKTGDRVLGMALGLVSQEPSQGGFQAYTVLETTLVSRIPDSLSYESASVLPACLSTAATALFQKNYLALQHPSINPNSTGETLLVWGGASSVGSNAIQLAVAAGYEVITTASQGNFDYVKKLGASTVFDYKSETVLQDLIKAFKGKKSAGAFAAARQGAEECLEVVDNSDGKKFVAMALYVPEKLPNGVEAKFVVGYELKDNEIGPAIYGAFLPQALAEGKYLAAPEPLIAGKGLESIQTAFDLQKQGVSARKVVVTL